MVDDPAAADFFGSIFERLLTERMYALKHILFLDRDDTGTDSHDAARSNTGPNCSN